MKLFKQILFLIFVFFVSIVKGQVNPEIQQDTTSLSGEIDEVTVTAFRSPYNLFNTPAPVNLITSGQLETGNSFTPIEALNQVPGVLMHHGTFNTNRLTIRGIGSRTPYSTNKIKAYFGEIPLTSGDGETTLEDLENSAIKRVEIIKGPSSSLYGAGLAGAILLIIQDSEKEREKFVPGIYHYSNEGVASWYDFANAVFEISRLNCQVKPVLSNEFPTQAKRPNFSVLDKSKIKNTFRLKIPFWRESLGICLKKLEKIG